MGYIQIQRLKKTHGLIDERWEVETEGKRKEKKTERSSEQEKRDGVKEKIKRRSWGWGQGEVSLILQICIFFWPSAEPVRVTGTEIDHFTQYDLRFNAIQIIFPEILETILPGCRPMVQQDNQTKLIITCLSSCLILTERNRNEVEKIVVIVRMRWEILLLAPFVVTIC